MTVTIEASIALELVICYACGITFGLPAEFDQHRRDDKNTWYCPNGHPVIYTGRPVRDRLSEAEGTVKLLREELSQAQDSVARKAKQLATLKRRTGKAGKRA